MRLTQKDVEAIARSRIQRAEGKRGWTWIIGAVVAVLLGYVVLQSDITNANMIGLVICALGFVVFVWYLYNLTKKQNAYKEKLVGEWRKEQRSSQQ